MIEVDNLRFILKLFMIRISVAVTLLYLLCYYSILITVQFEDITVNN